MQGYDVARSEKSFEVNLPDERVLIAILTMLTVGLYFHTESARHFCHSKTDAAQPNDSKYFAIELHLPRKQFIL